MRCLLLILLFGLVFTTAAQKPDKEKTRDRYIRIPAESGMVLTTLQTNSPLKFEQIDMLVAEDGSMPMLRYVLRNTSGKAIRYLQVGYYYKYTVPTWGRHGIGTRDGIGNPDGSGENIVFPGDTLKTVRWEEFEIVPMNNKVRKILSSEDGKLELKIVFFLYFGKVVFEDGSVFEERLIGDNIREFFFLNSECEKLLDHVCPVR